MTITPLMFAIAGCILCVVVFLVVLYRELTSIEENYTLNKILWWSLILGFSLMLYGAFKGSLV